MKISFDIKQKTKVAILLFCIMACTLLIRTLEDQNIKSLNNSFSSLYTDRLVPALLLFDIAEHLHAKQALINNILQGNINVAKPYDLLNQISAHDVAITGFVLKYEKTYLVKSEKQLLNELKISLDKSKLVEQSMSALSELNNTAPGRRLLELKTAQTFNAAVKNLKALMNIQNQVGEELIKESAFIISDNKIYSSLQTALAVMIGILTVALVFASRSIIIPIEKFHLN
jgi:hypothetical protein